LSSARVRNRDEFSGTMRFLLSRGWLFGQHPTNDDQEKSSERYVFKVHHYNSNDFDLTIRIVDQNNRLLDFRGEEITARKYNVT